jgi:hypothetical protein
MTLHTFFGSEVPAILNHPDPTPGFVGVSLGTIIAPTVSGNIVGVRFHKGTLDTGLHTFAIYNEILNLRFFGNWDTVETDLGWQTHMLDTPLSIGANVPNMAVVFHPNHYYVKTPHYFDTPVTHGVLHGYGKDESPIGNGCYHYGSSLGTPIDTFDATSYFVDFIFDDGITPPTPPESDEVAALNKMILGVL